MAKKIGHIPRERMSLRSGDSRRAARTKQRIGQTRVNPNHMPHRIVLRAWLPDGNILGIAMCHDEYVACVFDAREKPIEAPSVFKGGAGRRNARAFAEKLLGRAVESF